MDNFPVFITENGISINNFPLFSDEKGISMDGGIKVPEADVYRVYNRKKKEHIDKMINGNGTIGR